MADSNKRDGVFTGETRTITNPSPTAIKGHAGPHDSPAPTGYDKLPGKGGLASTRPPIPLDDDVNRPETADDVTITPVLNPSWRRDV